MSSLQTRQVVKETYAGLSVSDHIPLTGSGRWIVKRYTYGEGVWRFSERAKSQRRGREVEIPVRVDDWILNNATGNRLTFPVYDVPRLEIRDGDTVLVLFPIPDTREEPHYCLIATFKEAK